MMQTFYTTIMCVMLVFFFFCKSYGFSDEYEEDVKLEEHDIEEIRSAENKNTKRREQTSDLSKIEEADTLSWMENVEFNGMLLIEGRKSFGTLPGSQYPEYYYHAVLRQDIALKGYPFTLDMQYNIYDPSGISIGLDFDALKFREQLRSDLDSYNQSQISANEYLQFDPEHINVQITRIDRELNQRALRQDLERLERLEKLEQEGSRLNKNQLELKQQLLLQKERKERLESQKKNLEEIRDNVLEVREQLPARQSLNVSKRKLHQTASELEVKEMKQESGEEIDLERYLTIKARRDSLRENVYRLRKEHHLNSFSALTEREKLNDPRYMKRQLRNAGLLSDRDSRIMHIENASIGHTNVRYTPFTLDGLPLTGASGATYNGLLYLSATGGRERDNYMRTSRYNITALKTGVGKPGSDHIHINYTGTRAIYAEHALHDESIQGQPTLSYDVVSLNGYYRLTKRWAFEGELAGSNNKESEHGFIQQPQKFLNGETNAMSGALIFDNTGTGTEVTGRVSRIGSSFNNPALPYFRNDKMLYDLALRQYFYNRQIYIDGIYKHDYDNLENNLLMRSVNRHFGGGINLNIQDYPYFNIYYMPYIQNTIDNSGDIRYASRMDIVHGVSGYHFQYGGIQLHSQLTGVYQARSISTISNKTYYKSLGFNQGFNFPFKMGLHLRYQYNQQSSGITKNENHSGGADITYERRLKHRTGTLWRFTNGGGGHNKYYYEVGFRFLGNAEFALRAGGTQFYYDRTNAGKQFFLNGRLIVTW